MTDLAKIREREADPGVYVRAQVVSDKIMVRINQKKVMLYGELAKRVDAGKNRVDMLRTMTAEFVNASRGEVPCKTGCDYCCYIPTVVTMEEARVIAKETGAALTVPDSFSLKPDMTHTGTPCPFLTDHQCGIYASRPLSCRLHVAIDVDNLLCEIIPGETVRNPQFNAGPFHYLTALAFGTATVRPEFADIRVFFSTGLKNDR